ncbi:endonuclease/exonuclease/phosphatase family protein [Streptomyces sp. NPDC002055]|uniref:endonuclease/exonuclease/phosphatase family protein n=1 Tax=Streptomyces sp. NPDC002055 TaxID=3154534 RepID=UPI00332722D0
MELTVVVQNLGLGGLRSSSGDPEDRWPALAERIRGAGAPDLVLLQEACGWSEYGHRQLARAMDDLDLDAMPIPPSGSGIVPILLYRRETVGRWKIWNTDFADQSLHGFGVACFDVGLPAPLAVVSCHLDPFVADRARDEAKLIATRAYRYGPYALIGGDLNYPPAHPSSPAPDYATMRPYNIAARTRLPSEAGAPLVPDRRVTEMLAYAGYTDAAWHRYQQCGNRDLLRATGTDDRIDAVWVSHPLREAITDYRLLDSPAGASDHHGLAVRLDLTRAATDNVWDYR